MKKSVQHSHHGDFQYQPFFSLRGQAVLAEYVVILLIVVGALGAMTIYTKRTIQGRARDAQLMVLSAASKGLGGKAIPAGYEPYYVHTVTKAEQKLVDTSRVVGAGDYRKEYDLSKNTYMESRQKSPKAGQ